MGSSGYRHERVSGRSGSGSRSTLRPAQVASAIGAVLSTASRGGVASTTRSAAVFIDAKATADWLAATARPADRPDEPAEAVPAGRACERSRHKRYDRVVMGQRSRVRPPAAKPSALARSSALALVAVALGVTGCAHHSPQQPDLSFEPAIASPAYAPGAGPVVQIDEAHYNFHTIEGRYAPFAKLLRRDGYVVQALAEPATAEALGRGDIYVISNALSEANDKRWKLPSEPAFSESEIDAIRTWVEGGGSLFLVADHMPMPGSVEGLAAAFGVFFANGFLYDADGESHLEFARGAGLAEHPITDGRGEADRVSSVRTFTGQAFRATSDVEPLLTVPAGSRVLLPVKAWKFKETTASIPADGMLQGAVLRFGAGRVAVFGEAAMFSAQFRMVDGERHVFGMNEPEAGENPQFLLNVMHWLSERPQADQP